MSMAAGAASAYSDRTYELSEVKPDRLRLRTKDADLDVHLISDGQTTWTYNARREVYMKEDVAAASGWVEEEEETGDDEDSDEEQDLLLQAQKVLVGRYLTIARFASSARAEKDDRIKSSGNKLECYVVKIPTSRGTHRLWVDKERFLVLRHKEILDTKIRGVRARVENMLNLKVLQTAPPPPATLFTFVPPGNAKEVAVLDLPGVRVNRTGKSAASFRLKDVHGETVDFADLRGKVVLLDFWATWCPPCRKELPYIDKIAREYEDKGVAVIGVNYEDNGTIRNFLEKNKYTLTTLVDSRRKVHKLYAIRAFPTVIVINRKGIVVAHCIGSRTEEQLIAALKLAGLESSTAK